MMSDDKKQWTDDDRKKLDDAELDQAIGGAGKNPALGTPGGKKKPGLHHPQASSGRAGEAAASRVDRSSRRWTGPRSLSGARKPRLRGVSTLFFAISPSHRQLSAINFRQFPRWGNRSRHPRVARCNRPI